MITHDLGDYSAMITSNLGDVISASQITLVISPLLALISDQLNSLPPALVGATLTSDQTPQERADTHAGLRVRDACGAAVVSRDMRRDMRRDFPSGYARATNHLHLPNKATHPAFTFLIWQVRVLFVAPERLEDNRFQRFVSSLPPVAGCRCGAAGLKAAKAAAIHGLGASAACCEECGAPAMAAIGSACVDEARATCKPDQMNLHDES